MIGNDGISGAAVLVTGASRGLGLALVRALAARGGNIVAMCRKGAAADYDPIDIRVRWIAGDVRVDADCRQAVEATVNTFGRIDALINNAALGMDFVRRDGKDTWGSSASSWIEILDTNVVGLYRMTRYAVGFMREQKGGQIVNVSTSHRTMMLPYMSPYGPSKAAVEAMTASWATELANDGIRANIILPGGPCRTDMILKDEILDIPVDNLLNAGVLVPPVEWLLSPDGAQTTGSRLVGNLWPHRPQPISVTG